MGQVTIDTKIGDGVPVTLEFDYQPLEKQTLTDPEVPEDCQLTAVMVGEVDITSLVDDDLITRCEQDLLGGEYQDDDPRDDG
jgi:hypothetical protein